MSALRHEHCPICKSTDLKRVKQFVLKDVWRCRACKLAFFGHRASTEEISTFYAAYGRDHYESPVTELRYKELLKEFSRLTSGKKLLDYGCNSGFFLHVAAKNGWEVSGAEISTEAREICRKRGLKVTDLDTFYHLEKPETYDVITAVEVIEHMEFPDTFFSRAFELLKPGGVLYVTTPNFDALERRVLGDKYDIVNFPEHLCFFNKESLEKCANNVGFRKLKIVTTGLSLTRIRTSLRVSKEKYVSETSTDEQIRVRTENSSFFRMMKKGVNGMLNASSLGNALKGYFVKERV